MANRNTAPDAAFAHVMEVHGNKFKLLRHHYLDRVRDGNEHDTVDPTMLSFSLRMIDQAPVSDEVREEIRTHLRTHDVALADKNEPAPQPNDTIISDVNRQQLEKDPDMARRLVGNDDEGPDGNQNLKNPRIDMKLQPEQSAVVRTEDGTTTAQLVQPNAGGSITGGGSTPTMPGKDNSPGGPPGAEVELDVLTGDVEVKPTAGLGKPAHKDVVSVGPAQTGRPGIETDGGETVETSPGDVEKGAGLPSSSTKHGSGEKKSEENLHKPEEDLKGKKKVKARGEEDKDKKKSKVTALNPDILKPNPTGLLKKRSNLENIDMADKNKNQPGIKVQAVKAEVGDWVRNKEGRVGQIVAVSENNKATVKVPSTGHEVSNEGWQVIVKANEVNKDDPVDVLMKELRILNSPEALMRFATPTPEGQAARNNKIVLCSVQDLTQAGHKFVEERLYSAIAGKVSAKIQSVDKLGSRELVVVRMGDDDDFPISTMLEIRKNKDGKVDAISMFDSFLPVEAFKDFAKFLNSLAKQAPAKASVSSEDKAESGAKLERCVSDVLAKKVSDFKKKNGKAPSADKRKEMRSSAFAICTAQGLK